MTNPRLLLLTLTSTLTLMAAPALAAPCDELENDDPCTTESGKPGFCEVDEGGPANSGPNNTIGVTLVCEEDLCDGKLAGDDCELEDGGMGTCTGESGTNDLSNDDPGTVATRLYCISPFMSPCEGKAEGAACESGTGAQGSCEPEPGPVNGASNNDSTNNTATNNTTSPQLYCAVEQATSCSADNVGSACSGGSGTCQASAQSSNSGNSQGPLYECVLSEDNNDDGNNVTPGGVNNDPTGNNASGNNASGNNATGNNASPGSGSDQDEPEDDDEGCATAAPTQLPSPGFLVMALGLLGGLVRRRKK